MKPSTNLKPHIPLSVKKFKPTKHAPLGTPSALKQKQARDSSKLRS